MTATTKNLIRRKGVEYFILHESAGVYLCRANYLENKYAFVPKNSKRLVTEFFGDFETAMWEYLSLVRRETYEVFDKAEHWFNQ